jgi:hypothetical protein
MHYVKLRKAYVKLIKKYVSKRDVLSATSNSQKTELILFSENTVVIPAHMLICIFIYHKRMSHYKIKCYMKII